MKDVISQLIKYSSWLVITGAGISAASGVPTYRDRNGHWQRKPPVTHQDFLNSSVTRQRFWSRNMVGWRFMMKAQPNCAHNVLMALEQEGVVSGIVTQNVDGLHQRAGSRNVIDLHGRIDTVTCMTCRLQLSRQTLQLWLEQNNPEFVLRTGHIAPDGDAELDELDFSVIKVPECSYCGGLLKPDAVFFGDSIPKSRLIKAKNQLLNADALLVIGSSLSAYSGYRFCLWARDQGKPIVIINQGVTRGSSLEAKMFINNVRQSKNMFWVVVKARYVVKLISSSMQKGFSSFHINFLNGL
jgi:NAD-dependent SIR2 family protein deacetylase